MQTNTMQTNTTMNKVKKMIIKEESVADFRKTIDEAFGPLEKTYYVSEPYTRTVGTMHESVCDVAITIPEKIMIDGVELIAKIDNANGIYEFIGGYRNYVPKDLLVPHNDCDFCGTERGRTFTFLIEKDGGYMHVGSTCLGKFLKVDPKMILASVKKFREINTNMEAIILEFNGEDRRSLSWKKRLIPTERMVGICHEFIMENGFVAKRYEMSGNTKILVNPGENTSDRILSELFILFSVHLPENLIPLPGDKEKLAFLKDWLSKQPLTKTISNHYGTPDSWPTIWGECLDIINFEEVEIFRAGIIAYAVSQMIANKDFNPPASDFFLGPKEKFKDIPVVVDKVHEGTGVYGPFAIYTFKAGTHFLVYKGSKKIEGLEAGQKGILKGTVKSLDVYKGIKQTRIERYSFSRD